MAESFGRNSALTPFMSDTVFPLARNYDIHAMWWAAKQMGHPDTEMCAGFVNGFKIVGNLWPPTYIHRAKITQVTTSVPLRMNQYNARTLTTVVGWLPFSEINSDRQQ